MNAALFTLKLTPQQKLILFCLLAYLSLGIFQVSFVPIGNRDGAFSDESVHVASILDYATGFANTFQTQPHTIAESEILAYLGNRSRLVIPTEENFTVFDLLSGFLWQVTYLVHGAFQFLLPTKLTLAARIYLGRLFSLVLSAGLLLATLYLSNTLVKRMAFENWIGVATAAFFTPSVLLMQSTIATDSMSLTVGGVIVILTIVILHNGLTVTRMGLLIGLSVLALFTKETVWFAVGISWVVIIWQLLSPQWRRYVLLATGLLSVLLVGVALNWTPPALWGIASWYRPVDRNLEIATQLIYPTEISDGPVTRAIVVGPEAVVQKRFPDEDVFVLADNYPLQYLTALPKTATQVQVGSWILAPKGTIVSLPTLVFDDMYVPTAHVAFQASGQWELISKTVDVPANWNSVRVELRSERNAKLPVSYGDIHVYVVQTPVFIRDTTTVNLAAMFADQPNLVRNSEFETLWPDLLGSYRRYANRILYGVLDIEHTGKGYLDGIRSILSTLWASIAADNPGLQRQWVFGYLLLSIFGVVGWLGNFLLLGGKRRGAFVAIVSYGYLLVAVYLLFAIVTMTISPHYANPLFYAPSRRIYLIVPVLVALSTLGIGSILPKIGRKALLVGFILTVFAANMTQILDRETTMFNCELPVITLCVDNW